MDDHVRSALRIAKADGGELNSLPEDAPVPRNPDEAARLLAEHRQKIYAASQEPLKAEMEGILGSQEWQDQQQEAINRQSFSPERMRGMTPVVDQRAGLGLPNFSTPQKENLEANRAVELARSITNEENRQDLKAGLKQTWPVQMAEDIYMAARAPGDALYGKLDPNSDLAIKRMFDLAGATAMQAPVAMAAKPDPSKIGIFGGAGARTADQSLLKQAQSAAERGMPEQDIWRETGWWKAPDGQWRFEVPDQAMEIARVPRPGNEVPLASVVKHDQLFKAYPQLNDVRIKFEELGEGGYGGFYQPGAEGQIGHIVINRSLPPDMQRSVAAHELQHVVQRIEGFAAGTNPSEFQFPAPMRNRLFEENEALNQAQRIQALAREAGIDPLKSTPKQLEFLTQDPRVRGDGDLNPKALEYAVADPERLKRVQSMVQDVQSLAKQNGYEGYRRTMGEVEARNVQERLGDNPNSPQPELSADINQTQRALNILDHPGVTQDVPAGQQIYRSWDAGANAPAMNKEDLIKQGYKIKAYHGTLAPEDFRNWRIADEDIGVHFGTKGAANKRLKIKQRSGEYENSRIVPVQLKINNPLHVPDVAADWVKNIHNHFINKRIKTIDTSDYPFKNSENVTREDLVNYIKSKGYDGLSYDNIYERGKSYVVFDPEQQVASQFGPDPKTGRMFSSSDPSVPVATAALEAARNRKLSQIGLYSHGAESASLLPQPRGTPQQFRAMLERAGVKPDELKGFEEAFAGQKQITREQAAEFFNERMPKVEETVLGSQVDNKFLEEAAKEIYDSFRQSEWKKNLPEWETLNDSQKREYFDLAIESSDHYRIAPAKFSEYTLPGGENYREVLLRLPQEQADYSVMKNQRRALKEEQNKLREEARRMPEDSEEHSAAFNRVAEIDRQLYELDKKLDVGEYAKPQFQSSHWDEPNVLAHIRMADRTGPKGEKILHVEEMQSDWAQKGRKEGFKTEPPKEIQAISEKMNPGHKNDPHTQANEYDTSLAVAEGLITKEEADKLLKWKEISGTGMMQPAPYVTSTQGWTDLALKRILKEAADNGYDQIVFTPGAEQAKRYDLSKQISRVTFNDNYSGADNIRPDMSAPPGAGNLNAYDLNGKRVISKYIKNPSELSEIIGKEAADKLLKQEPTEKLGGRVFELAGQNLSVGGEGMKGYYDKIVPAQLQKLLKKIDPEARFGRYSEVQGTKGKGLSDAEKNLKLWEDNKKIYEQDFNAGHFDKSEYQELIAHADEEIALLKDRIQQYQKSLPKIEMLSVQITPRMREAIKRGLPAFKDGGAVTPSPAQIEAGNYKKQHKRFAGLEIAIENQKGSTRSGTDKGGKRWSVQMPADYGYIKRTEGADGDHVDVYVGPHENSRKVFIINQKDLSSGKFDEHKVMVGFNSQTEAMACYKAGFSDGKGSQRAGSVQALSINEFKNWLKNGDQTKEASDKALAKALELSAIGPDAAQRAVHLASSKGA